MDKNKIKEKAKELIKASQIFVLSTAEGNLPKSRFMGSLVEKEDFAYYMETYSSSNKVAQIKKNPNVQLLFFRNDYSEIVTLTGKAAIVDSLKIKEFVFNSYSNSKKYFKGFEDKGFAVIEFKAEAIDFLTFEHKQFRIRL